MITIPAFVLRGLYVKGSLKNTENGFQVTIRNHIDNATVTAMESITVDGVTYGADAITVKTPAGERPCSEVTASAPFILAVKQDAILIVHGTPLAAGEHKIVFAWMAELVGRVLFDVTDTIS